VRWIFARAPEQLGGRGAPIVEIGHSRAAFECADPRLAFTLAGHERRSERAFLLRRRDLTLGGAR
jgi:hypothetical protein